MAHWLSVGTICRDFGLHVRPMEFCPTAGTRVSSEGLRSDSNPMQVWVGLDWEFHAPHQILDQVAARRQSSTPDLGRQYRIGPTARTSGADLQEVFTNKSQQTVLGPPINWSTTE